MEVIKKRYPIRDENGNSATYPTFASQVFFNDGSALEGKAFGGGTLYTNFADNSDFTKWVAQADIGGAHGAQAYGGDRWKLTSGTITGEENADGVGYSSITLNGTLTQIVPSPPAVATPFIEMISGTAEISYDAENGEISITSSGGVIKNVLLLEGEWAQKPGYVAKGYGAELLECQRYYQDIDRTLCGLITSSGKTIRINFPMPVKMRILPTVLSYRISGIRSVTGSNTAVTVSSCELNERQDASIDVLYNLTDEFSTTNNTPIAGYFGATLLADL